MSEENTNNNVTENQEEEKKDVKYNISIDPIAFGGICTDKYLKGTEFCKILYKIFKAVYADFYGATFDTIPGTNKFMISLYFDHEIHDGDSLPCAVSKVTDEERTENATLNSIRRFQRRNTEGDRYHLTPEGKEGIKKFLMDQRLASNIYKSTGYNKVSPDWKKISIEVADASYGGNFSRQLTKVSYLDCEKLASMIWGSKENEASNDPDDVIEYGVRIANSFPTYGGYNSSPEYLLEIKRISRKHIVNLCQSFGIGIQHGLNIIRG